MVLEVLDAPSPEGRDDFEAWLLAEYLPSRVTPESPVDIAMLWRISPH